LRYVCDKDANKVVMELVSRYGWVVEGRKKHVIVRHPSQAGRRRTLPHGSQRIGREALKNLRKELRVCEEEADAERRR
jgi:hypothetical protein